MTAKLTIGVPVFNGERYLAETLRSLLEQSVSDFAVLVSDNGSTDGSADIAARFARDDARVTVQRHGQNRGAAWNYNWLVGATTTEFFKWSGADDLYAPDYVERCLDRMEHDASRPVLVYPRTRLIDADGAEIRDYHDGLDLRDLDPRMRLDRLLRNLGLANAVFGLLRTDVLRRTPLIAAYNDSDVVLLLDLCLRGPFVEVPEVLFFRRMHAAQAYQANTTAREVRAWFDPSARGRFLAPRARRFVEAARTIARAPLSASVRLGCGALLLRRWLARDVYHSARELPATVSSLFGSSRAVAR